MAPGWEPCFSPPEEPALCGRHGLRAIILFSWWSHLTLTGALPLWDSLHFSTEHLSVHEISGLVDGLVGSQGGPFKVLLILYLRLCRDKRSPFKH